MTIKVFFDASALFSAAYSTTGGSRELIRWAIQGRIELLVSEDVLEETTRNLQLKAPDKVEVFQTLMGLLDLTVIPDPSKKQVWDSENHVAQKDAAIIAAVKKSGADFFVTLDKQHLLDKPELAEYAGVPIGTPKEALDLIRV